VGDQAQGVQRLPAEAPAVSSQVRSPLRRGQDCPLPGADSTFPQVWPAHPAQQGHRHGADDPGPTRPLRGQVALVACITNCIVVYPLVCLSGPLRAYLLGNIKTTKNKSSCDMTQNPSIRKSWCT
jgi:hypothetical protein